MKGIMKEINWRFIVDGDILFINNKEGYAIINVIKAEPIKAGYRWILGKCMSTDISHLKPFKTVYFFLTDDYKITVFEDGDEHLLMRYLV